MAAPAASERPLVRAGAPASRRRRRLCDDGRHPGDGRGDRHRRFLRRRLPLDAMGGAGAPRERARRRIAPAWPPPATTATSRIITRSCSGTRPRPGSRTHRGDARRHLDRGKVQERAPAHGAARLGGIQGQQLAQLPHLPRVHARRAGQAEGLRAADAPAGAAGQRHLHRLPQGRRAHACAVPPGDRRGRCYAERTGPTWLPAPTSRWRGAAGPVASAALDERRARSALRHASR